MGGFQKFSGHINRQGYLILTCGVSGKFEFLSMNCQGNVREFCDGWSVATMFWSDYNCYFFGPKCFSLLDFLMTFTKYTPHYENLPIQ